MDTAKKNCRACLVASHGIKTRIAVVHTCAIGDKKYVETESMVCGVLGKHFKISFHQVLYSSKTSIKYTIVRGQYLNGYKVPAGSTLWVPDNMHHEGPAGLKYRYIWVKEKFYNQLAFV